MRKYLLHVGILLLLIFSSCQENELLHQEPIAPFEPLTKQQINQVIIDRLQDTGDFQWNDLTNTQLQSAFLLSDNLVDVAWNFETGGDTEKKAILDFIYASEGKTSSDEEVILEVSDNLKILTARISKTETLLGLRQLPEVEVIEPHYAMFSKEEVAAALRKSQNKLTEPKEPMSKSSVFDPAVMANHDIDAAWNAGITGKGIRVAVVDNGVLQNGVFDKDLSPKKIELKSRYKEHLYFGGYDSPYIKGGDLSGDHGNAMMTTIGGPASATKGVAYETDLISIRSSYFFGLFEPRLAAGVRRSFEYLATRGDVKIISMSQGWLTPWTWMNRAIKSCIAQGKMVFLAGGTGAPDFLADLLGDILFDEPDFTLAPARYSNDSGWSSAHAVSGITDWLHTDNINKMRYCATCFGTSDFVVEFPKFQGSSSQSTATTAGMAALIWSKNPSCTAADIFDEMRKASDFPNQRHPEFGHGRVNMKKFLATNSTNTIITLKGSNNRYVSSENGTNRMRCNRSGVGSWEKFKLIRLADGKVALRGSNGKYVSSENGSSLGMNCNRSSIGSWEKFTLVNLPGGKVALRGNNGRYVSSENGSYPMRCNRSSIGSWEQFTMTTL